MQDGSKPGDNVASNSFHLEPIRVQLRPESSILAANFWKEGQ